MEEICCNECGDGLGLWFPKGKYDRRVYCEDCYDLLSEPDCEEAIAQATEEKDAKIDELEAEVKELQEAEIAAADRVQELESEIEA